jgi:2-methylisocitrate lyase-like PEP mutase family enzyme
MGSMSNAKASAFHALHRPGSALVLPNAWDVASALLVERAGAAAVATTSAGVAWCLGAPDGDTLDRDRAVGAVARIAAAVDAPVTADIESGFAPTPAGVTDTVRAIAAAGAVGINIEDGAGPGLRTTADAAERVAAARAADADLFINARVDTFLRAVGEPETRLADTLARAKAYLAAGASGVFVPGVADPATIEALVAGIDAPLNVLAGPGAPTIGELNRLGVARVSIGSVIPLVAYAVAERVARELLTAGTYPAAEDLLGYGDLNSLMAN